MTDTLAHAILHIDLDAIAHNWRVIRDLHPSRNCAAVVKADGYGLGATEVAMRLYREGCQQFFTALPEEAIALRQAFDIAEIYQVSIAVMGGILPGQASLFSHHRILPVLNDPGQIEMWRKQAASKNRILPAALQSDSGMTRLGLDHRDAVRLADDPTSFEGISLEFLMSHLCCADTPDHDMNARQNKQFRQTRDLFPDLPASLAATAGSFLGPDFHFDFLRPGIGLYGSTGTRGERAKYGLKPVMRLVGRIAQIRHITPGTEVGYGATWTAQRPSVIATVGIGYADGYLRSLSNKGVALVRGQEVPLAGRVSMDLLTFDVTDAYQQQVIHPGDEIDLLGGPIDLDRQAEQADTISYELLTSLGGRYKRRYTGM